MLSHYTNERNVQIVIALMKAHGVRRVIASPGTTNITFVGSIQQDPFFEVYSSVDERSAAYMACGMAAETGEPVALSCTGATASRNYVPGLTEAFYRQLPVLAITSTQHMGRVGQYVPQVIDRSVQMNDMCKMSRLVPTCHTKEDEWAANLHVNEALLELRHAGGGPVHLNVETEYSRDFSVKELPAERVIRRFLSTDELPSVPEGKVGIIVGAHAPFDDRLTRAVNSFCEAYDAIVVCEQASNYRGPFRVLASLATEQMSSMKPYARFSLLVHVGQVGGGYISVKGDETWRVNPDGVVRDAFKTLTGVFEMDEAEFFEQYVRVAGSPRQSSSVEEWNCILASMRDRIPELPLSGLWIAQQTAPALPGGSSVHLGILNTIRSWDMFETPDSVSCYANTGGFGIDGGMSALLGASLASPGKLFFGVLGDLAFFYDMNSLGNRHVGSNVRILLVNNGIGTEFKNYSHTAADFGDDADAFMAAGGHYGCKSADLVKHYATDLGFEYVGVSNKEEFLDSLPRFVEPDLRDCPMLLEVFTDDADESDALKAIRSIEHDAAGSAKHALKGVLGNKGVSVVKKMLGR